MLTVRDVIEDMDPGEAFSFGGMHIYHNMPEDILFLQTQTYIYDEKVERIVDIKDDNGRSYTCIYLVNFPKGEFDVRMDNLTCFVLSIPLILVLVFLVLVIGTIISRF